MNRKYRKTVIAGNWKMNKTPSQTKEFMVQLKNILPRAVGAMLPCACPLCASPLLCAPCVRPAWASALRTAMQIPAVHTPVRSL